MDVRRGAERARSVVGGLDTRHGFSFGAHYDPDNTHFGAMLAHNDDHVAPGAGYDDHPHRDVDIVTWVVAGALAHTDSTGTEAVVEPGVVQLLSAGAGVVHAERAAGGDPVHFVQTWLVPDRDGPPRYAQRDVRALLAAGEPFVVASGVPGRLPAGHGRGGGGRAASVTAGSSGGRYGGAEVEQVLALRRRDATLYAARLSGGREWTLPVARFVQVFVTDGSARAAEAEPAEPTMGAEAEPAEPTMGTEAEPISAETEPAEPAVESGACVLAAGDELRLTAPDGPWRLVAGARGAEVLVWEMGSGLVPDP